MYIHYLVLLLTTPFPLPLNYCIILLLLRYNLKRRLDKKPPITEQEFEAMIEQGDDVSKVQFDGCAAAVTHIHMQYTYMTSCCTMLHYTVGAVIQVLLAPSINMKLLVLLQVSSISGSDTDSSEDEDSDDEGSAAAGRRAARSQANASIQGAQAVFRNAGKHQCR